MKYLTSILFLLSLPSALFVTATPAPAASHTYQNGGDHHRNRTVLDSMEYKYKHQIRETLRKRGSHHKCNSKTVSIRREWY